MKVKRNVGAAALSALALVWLAGCSTTKLEEPAPVESRTTTDNNANANTTKPAESAVKTVDLGANAVPPAGLGRTVYFDFDSFVVKDEFRPIVEGYAKYLGANKAKKMLIEGHTDERGSREYNLALGQKRAEAVQKAMLVVGATDGQLEAVSFGEERPAAQGSDEAAWAKNRRAELKDR
ncbi:peptidoglycan-associated lipoprotein Pal [Ideonella sp. DXS29W]|uniref:Peptidoglycan-associated lipoprotein n=1 Tax=Ideonella lacteola TaxID=2984193 RepID=A0ABU9BRP0_9BURK